MRVKLPLLIVASLLLLWFLAWVAARALIVEAPLVQADVIVVLSGSAAFAERPTLAAQLYHQGRASKIILTNDNQRSGWSSADERNPLFYERAVTLLRNADVPAEAIAVILQPISSTHDEGMVVRHYAESHGVQSVLVVTSAYHSRRALWTFRRSFIHSGITVGLEGALPGWQSPAPATWWLHWAGWRMVPGEYIKMIYYWWSYQAKQ